MTTLSNPIKRYIGRAGQLRYKVAPWMMDRQVAHIPVGLAIRADRALGSTNGIETPAELMMIRGVLDQIRSDRGREFTSALGQWSCLFH